MLHAIIKINVMLTTSYGLRASVLVREVMSVFFYDDICDVICAFNCMNERAGPISTLYQSL